MEVIRQIKWAYQRVARGYDDRIYWEFDSYFNQFIPALKQFCEDQLEDEKHCELNKQRCLVFQETLSLIKKWETAEYSVQNKECEDLWTFFGMNIGFYWD
jgi:hypothetical protein